MECPPLPITAGRPEQPGWRKTQPSDYEKHQRRSQEGMLVQGAVRMPATPRSKGKVRIGHEAGVVGATAALLGELCDVDPAEVKRLSR